MSAAGDRIAVLDYVTGQELREATHLDLVLARIASLHAGTFIDGDGVVVFLDGVAIDLQRGLYYYDRAELERLIEKAKDAAASAAVLAALSTLDDEDE